jgi:DNA-binding response OmpR family regulator
MSDKKKVGQSILLIEDEPALRDIFSTKLRMEGFDVIEAGDGVEGLASAIEKLPSLILLDVVLPIKDGFAVLRDLKDHPRTKQIPVVFLSNLGQDFEVRKGMSLGAKNFLTKANLTPASLIDEIRKILVT